MKNTNHQRRASAVAAAVLGITIALTSWPGNAAEINLGAAVDPSKCTPDNKRELTIGQVPIGWSNTAFQIADAGGLFKKHGVEFKRVNLSAGGQVPALIGGNIDLSGGGMNKLMDARDQGISVLAFASDSSELRFQVVISDKAWKRAGLSAKSTWQQRLAALKGLSIAGGRPGTEMDNVLTVLLKTAKLDPEKSVTRLAVERGAPQIAALRQNRVDGVIITQPDSAIAAGLVGGHVLIDLEDGTVPPLNGVQYGVYIASEQWLNKPENQQAAGCFVLALQGATDLARTDFPRARDLLLAQNSGSYPDVPKETLKASIRPSALMASGPAINPAAVDNSYRLSGRTSDKNGESSKYYTTKILERFLAKR